MKAFLRAIATGILVSMVWGLCWVLCAGGLWASGASMEPGPDLFTAYLIWTMLSTVLTVGLIGLLGATGFLGKDGGGA